MSEEKWKSKIRKLLALAQSDNPHEAERAKSQAEKLMARHGITAEDSQIATVSAETPFRRKSPKESELWLMAAIEKISGCVAYMNSKRRHSWQAFQTTPQFMGPKVDAEIAAYCWDVLYSQLKLAQSDIKKRHRIRAREIEMYSLGWAQIASKKLVNAFGHKEQSSAASQAFERASVDFGKAKILRAARSDDKELDQALLGLGASAGAKANLHVGAENSRKKEPKLTKQIA